MTTSLHTLHGYSLTDNDIYPPFDSKQVYLLISENSDDTPHWIHIKSYVGYTDAGSHEGVMVTVDEHPEENPATFTTVNVVPIKIYRDEYTTDDWETYVSGKITRTDTNKVICTWNSSDYPMPSSTFHWSKYNNI